MTRSIRCARRAAALLVLVLTAVLVAPATPAHGHVQPIARTDPARDSVVRSVDLITVEFTGPIRTTATTFTLRSSDGVDHALAAPEFAAGDTVVRLRPADGDDIPDGLYRVGYQVTFTDGHPAVGVVQFEVSRSGESRGESWPADDPAPGRAEPERLDAAGQWPWLAGGAVVLVAGFGLVVWRLRSRA